jgi:nascent polypeptide-associated complex subunit alpha
MSNIKEEAKIEEHGQEGHVHGENCHHEQEGHVHGENCQHEHDEEKKGGKSEKKVRKALGKLGMVKMEGVNRVTVRQKDNYILVVKDPEVFSSSQTENTFIIFGEITFEDPDKVKASEAIKSMTEEPLKPTSAETSKPVEVVEEEGEVSEEGVDPANIEAVMNECNCTRQKAVRALKKNNGDVVNAILALSG